MTSWLLPHVAIGKKKRRPTNPPANSSVGELDAIIDETVRSTEVLLGEAVIPAEGDFRSIF